MNDFPAPDVLDPPLKELEEKWRQRATDTLASIPPWSPHPQAGADLHRLHAKGRAEEANRCADELEAALLAQPAPQPPRMFPVQDGPAIPWDIIAPFDKQCQRNHGRQTLEDVARRGGLGTTEAIAVLLGVDYFDHWERDGRYKREDHAKHVQQLVGLIEERTGWKQRAEKAEAELATLRAWGPQIDLPAIAVIEQSLAAGHYRNREDFGDEQYQYSAEGAIRVLLEALRAWRRPPHEGRAVLVSKDENGFTLETRRPGDRGAATLDVPRRAYIEKMIPAELKIREAILAVEELGADVRLTDVVVRLGEAQSRLADYADDRIAGGK